jgi:hypothetical protein
LKEFTMCLMLSHPEKGGSGTYEDIGRYLPHRLPRQHLSPGVILKFPIISWSGAQAPFFLGACGAIGSKVACACCVGGGIIAVQFDPHREHERIEHAIEAWRNFGPFRERGLKLRILTNTYVVPM